MSVACKTCLSTLYAYAFLEFPASLSNMKTMEKQYCEKGEVMASTIGILYSGYFSWGCIFCICFFGSSVESAKNYLRKFVTCVHMHVVLQTVVSVKHVAATIAILQRLLQIKLQDPLSQFSLLLSMPSPA